MAFRQRFCIPLAKEEIAMLTMTRDFFTGFSVAVLIIATFIACQYAAERLIAQFVQ